MYRHVLYFIVLGCLYAVISLPIKTNWYFYFRNLSIIYSAFAFFIGFYLYEQQFEFYQRAKKWIYGYALTAFALRWPVLIDRNAYTYWLTLVQRSWRPYGVIILLAVMIIYLFAYTSMSVLMVMVAIITFRFLTPTYTHFKLFCSITLVVFGSLFVASIPYLKLYDDGTTLFGDVVYVYSQHPWFNIDHNTSWRFIFWYRTLVESFPQNLLGVGVGTPILPYLPGAATSDLLFPDEHIAHVIGTHNTFITIFVRFGIFALFIFIIIYRNVMRDFFSHRNYYYSNRNDLSIFLSFVALTAVGMFNLLIETPTLAALFWISLGLVAGAINNRKYVRNGV